MRRCLRISYRIAADPWRPPGVRLQDVPPPPSPIPHLPQLDIGRHIPLHACPDRPALRRFTFVRCCGSLTASIPRALAGKTSTWSVRFRLAQLLSARGYLQQVPQRTFTSNLAVVPGAQRRPRDVPAPQRRTLRRPETARHVTNDTEPALPRYRARATSAIFTREQDTPDRSRAALRRIKTAKGPSVRSSAPCPWRSAAGSP